ncbi:hypothetical protein [Bradyrhizobium ottawaense]|uniref:hypothetical protein n=1 Tax=Bradyrhizobium ottawaense TaxID=931866 RepID=UPI0030C71C94
MIQRGTGSARIDQEIKRADDHGVGRDENLIAPEAIGALLRARNDQGLQLAALLHRFAHVRVLADQNVELVGRDRREAKHGSDFPNASAETELPLAENHEPD